LELDFLFFTFSHSFSSGRSARARRRGRNRRNAVLLDDGHVSRFRAFCPLARLELNLRAFGEGLEAVTRDLRMVDKQILPTVFGRDEAVALRVTEPFHGSSCHRKTPPLPSART